MRGAGAVSVVVFFFFLVHVFIINQTNLESCKIGYLSADRKGRSGSMIF